MQISSKSETIDFHLYWKFLGPYREAILRVIDHGLATMKFNAKNIFDLETWNLQGQGHRQRSQWVELIKVYLHVKFERGIVNGHSAALNLIARAKPNC